MRAKSISLMGICVLAVILLLPVFAFATPWTPIEWQEGGKLRGWVRDRNNNFVDDQIEGSSDQMEVIVDLNQCVGDVNTSDIVKFISARGDITFTGTYLTFLIVVGIDAKEAMEIAGRSEVAMVELAEKQSWLGGNYRAAKVQTSGDYSPNTLQDAFGWSGTLNGSGINIAFLDTGVGAAYNGNYVYGYNAITDTVENPLSIPEDRTARGLPVDATTIDHATWMASWVFGPGKIAPSAGLIDIKIGDESGVDTDAEARALRKIYDERNNWNIHVVVMMYSGSSQLDGREERQQYLDMLNGLGIVVVAGTGGNSADSLVSGPGAASRAIGVSTCDIVGTVNRGDDDATYVRGPRASDGDTDQLDELKPEVIFPTGEPGTQISNSIATALTGGLAALALDRNADMADRSNKAAGAVKDLLIRSAESKGTPDTTVAYPHAAASWDQYWGFGEIDAHQAVANLSDGTQGGRADLTFQSFDGVTPHPNDPYYYSLAVETMSERLGNNIQAGVSDTIYARVYNNGPNPADRVRVSFGFYPFTAGIPKFYDIGSKIVDVPTTTAVDVDINWMPPDLGSGDHHGCILVSIDYGYDMDFSNKSNFAQKNIRVHGTSSPAVFTFNVANPLPGKATMVLKTINRNRNWEFKLSDNNFVLEAGDCARKIKAIADPGPNVKKGEEALFFVTLFVRPFGTEKMIEAGGVACKARNEPERKLIKPKSE